jgi:hypothetical protein
MKMREKRRENVKESRKRGRERKKMESNKFKSMQNREKSSGKKSVT